MKSCATCRVGIRETVQDNGQTVRVMFCLLQSIHVTEPCDNWTPRQREANEGNEDQKL